MPRFFSLLEAEALLPEVEKHLKQLMVFKQQAEEAQGAIALITQRIAIAGVMLPPRNEIAELRRQKQSAALGLKTTVEAIHALGCQLKDAEIGLIDFPTLYRGQEVYLCWKLGEQGIGFWHRVEDGYRGRHSIDNEFLSNHRGDEQGGEEKQ